MINRFKKPLKLTGVVLATVFVFMQFYRPAKNQSPSGPDDLFAIHPAGPEVERLIRASCYDCHSNQTRYPWYAEVQPAAWWLAKHIKEGKGELNFSEFGSYAQHRQAQKLLAIADEVHGGTMPLKSYTWMHREARLGASEVQALADWAESLADEIEAGK